MDANELHKGPTAEPVLLLPGLMCDSRVFAAQLSAFPNARAAADYTLERDLGAMAGRVIDAAPARFALLGHSMGGRVALEVIRRVPDRVTRLALLSTGVHMPTPGEAPKRYALRDLGRSEGMAALVDAWLPPMVAPDRARDPHFMAPLRAMCIEAGLARFEAQIAALLSRPEVESLLPHIACPVLVAAGSEDVWSPPAQHEAIAALLPDAHLVVVEGAGHMLPVEAPDALNDAIAAWLARPIETPYPSQGEVE
ncbi:alpha/beta hydrolase [Sphingomonas oligophenolica]|uniref:Alpha/beta hydrolase n=1 Tax=Sphingomonas oligophenolica TaxID=301154 RepID=A0ABU9XYJ2_9SPHN